MNENTFHGNVGKNPEINYGKNNGIAVVNFSIAINSRRFDRAKGQWVTRPTVWKDVVCFGEFAENVYDSIAKGMTVTVTGEEVDDSYTKESYEPGGEDIVIRRHKIEARGLEPGLVPAAGLRGTLGRLVGGGELEEQTARQILLDAAAGHLGPDTTEREVVRDIDDGIAYGRKLPRSIRRGRERGTSGCP